MRRSRHAETKVGRGAQAEGMWTARPEVAQSLRTSRTRARPVLLGPCEEGREMGKGQPVQDLVSLDFTWSVVSSH